MASLGIAIQRACRLLTLQRSTYYRKHVRRDERALRLRLREFALARLRYGYRRLHVLLRREGWPINTKGPRMGKSTGQRSALPYLMAAAATARAMDRTNGVTTIQERGRRTHVAQRLARVASHCDAWSPRSAKSSMYQQPGPYSSASASAVNVADGGPNFTRRVASIPSRSRPSWKPSGRSSCL